MKYLLFPILLALALTGFAQKAQPQGILPDYTPHHLRNPQEITSPISQMRLKIAGNGAVWADLSTWNLSVSETGLLLPTLSGLSLHHSFQKVRETTDELGILHQDYQQYYDGLPVKDHLLLVHARNGRVTAINGHLARIEAGAWPVAISGAEAVALAQAHEHVTTLLNEWPASLLILHTDSLGYRMAYKTRIDAINPLKMREVYVGASTGQVLHTHSLIAQSDVQAFGKTLYSGQQSFTADSHNGSYRLHEAGRNIETYNGEFAVLGQSAFSNVKDFTDSDNSWNDVAKLQRIVIDSLPANWPTSWGWYVEIRNSANALVYRTKLLYSATAYANTAILPNLVLDQGPYTMTVISANGQALPVSGIPISMTPGGTTLRQGGVKCRFNVVYEANSAIDAHWGMEKVYDYYQSVHSRNSYDGNGSTIKNYVNAALRVSDQTNNAFALPAPYNFMVFGEGDRVNYNPLVSLDVMGHEFTHMVVSNNGHGGLNYEKESGALNESFADIFGNSIEAFARPGQWNWNIGEDCELPRGGLRSMQDPNAFGCADTYGGSFWGNPNNSHDHGYVHYNSGVQNFWFYLLVNGGSGTNDKGNAYAVTGIGMAAAQRIAYRNLMVYLTPTSDYFDAWQGAVRAAEDLYGAGSAEVQSVRHAWYAVGMGPDPTSYCAGSQYFSGQTGTISDGSNGLAYGNFSVCTWRIVPPGADEIDLYFTAFDTEANYDYVRIYNGPDDSAPLLGQYSGNTLPPVITASGGAMCIKFTSDNGTNGSGWEAHYEARGLGAQCGHSMQTSASGVFDNGSSGGYYANNQLCSWLIAPPCASAIVATFPQFDLSPYPGDAVEIFDGGATNAPLLGTFTYNNPPPAALTASHGEMLVVFSSDHTANGNGFQVSYSSLGTAACVSASTLTAPAGSLDDGSPMAEYCHNQHCQWLIEPQGADFVLLSFSAFDVEPALSDGRFFDYVAVYDGAAPDAPLLGKFAGDAVPPALRSSAGQMLVEFVSDYSVQKTGWSAVYESVQSAVAPANMLTFSLMPNPAQTTVQVSLPVAGPAEVMVCDLTGRQCLAHRGETQEMLLDIRALPAGVYWVRVVQHGQQAVQKLAIVH